MLFAWETERATDCDGNPLTLDAWHDSKNKSTDLIDRDNNRDRCQTALAETLPQAHSTHTTYYVGLIENRNETIETRNIPRGGQGTRDKGCSGTRQGRAARVRHSVASPPAQNQSALSPRHLNVDHGAPGPLSACVCRRAGSLTNAPCLAKTTTCPGCPKPYLGLAS